MILTNKQAHWLVYILQDSLKMDVRGYLSLSYKTRLQLLDEILRQQDDTPVQILGEKEESENRKRRN